MCNTGERLHACNFEGMEDFWCAKMGLVIGDICTHCYNRGSMFHVLYVTVSMCVFWELCVMGERIPCSALSELAMLIKITESTGFA